uniref:Carboxyl-terminal-processing peptidase 2ic-like isoform X1 n=1 Tax=Rhizophora mucronata TaxID=61149 RepID=A0A2P2LYW6_RHIMU
MLSVLVSSIARMKSPDKMPALCAGPPEAAEMTTSPTGDPLETVG